MAQSVSVSVSAQAPSNKRPARDLPLPALPFRLVMRPLFYALFLASLMFTILAALPVRLFIPLGGSQLRETDILLLAFVALWIAGLCFLPTWPRRPQHKLVWVLVLVLLCPVATGLASGKALAVVLRDFRTPAFFLAILPMLTVIRTYRDLERLMRFMTIVATISLLAGFVLWVKAPPAEGEPFRVGIASTLPLVVWQLFLCVGLISFEKKARLRRFAWAYVLLALVFIFVANDIRSMYVGVVGALVFASVAALFGGRQLRVRRRIMELATGVIFVSGLLGALFLSVDYWGRGIQEMVKADLRLRRLYSLVDPTLGGELFVGFGGTNRDDRLLGLTYGFELGARNAGFGLGYGDNPFVDLDPALIDVLVRRNALEGMPGNTVENMLFVHNSYGWAFGRLGLWFALAYFGIVVRLCWRAWKAMLRTDSEPLRIILLGTLANVVYILLLGFGGAAFFDYTGQGLVPWLVCVTVLIRATFLANAASARTVSSRPTMLTALRRAAMARS